MAHVECALQSIYYASSEFRQSEPNKIILSLFESYIMKEEVSDMSANLPDTLPEQSIQFWNQINMESVQFEVSYCWQLPKRKQTRATRTKKEKQSNTIKNNIFVLILC